MRRFALLLAALLGPAFFRADAETVRIAEFRDGSRLRVTLADESLAFHESLEDGNVAERTLSVAALNRAQFSKVPALEKLARIHGAIQRLGDERFPVREQALADLCSAGEGFREVIARRMESSTSPEARWRLARVLDFLPPESLPPSRTPYDAAQTGTGAAMQGDFGNWSLAASYRNVSLPLSRKTVISLSAAEKHAGPDAAPPDTRRLGSHEDRAFVEGSRTITFDTGPKGRELAVGEPVSDRFVDWGVVLQTSIAGGTVSVNDYEVGSPSRGQSAATRDPLYEGIVTIRFCVPGHPGIPAGVDAVGVWAAIVLEKGTVVQAWDAHGNLLREAVSGVGPSEFFGFKSNVPIHILRIIPVPEIDPNYTLDDLVFTPPRSVDGVGVEKFSTVRFRDGDRLVCAEFSIDGEELELVPSSFPESKVTADLAEFRAIHSPLGGDDEIPGGDVFWVRFADGSRMLATTADGTPSIARFPELPLSDFQLAGLWGKDEIGRLPPEDVEWKEGRALLLRGSSFVSISVRGFGKRWIESDDDLGAEFDAQYALSPVVWLAAPQTIPPSAGALQFPSGEVIRLGGDSGFRLRSLTREEVVIERGGHRWAIPFSQIASIQFPDAP